MRKPVLPRLILDTKEDILFDELSVVIHQPSISEISLIDENNFVIGIQSLTKDYQKNLATQGNFDSSETSNFDILMSMINEKSENAQIIKKNIFNVLFLIFPQYNIIFTPRSILLQDLNDKTKTHILDNQHFEKFADIIYDMFCLSMTEGQGGTEYNPAGDRARALVKKFKEKREFLANQKKQRGEDFELQSLYGRYMNILAVGEGKDKNVLKQYSVFQLIEEFKRFQLKEEFDYTFHAKMAGATKIKDAKNWMEDINFSNDDENN